MSDQDTQPIPVPAEGESHRGNTGEIKPPTRDGEQQPEEPTGNERSSASSDERKRD
jgi:hypothetical protein